ncbi:hypothetical protein AWV80_19420 [Cupriavidus sp. UYMU48A]|nr:hypothetical protein AWV80_19420 [Cupriavidus sp. UYMU48A]
MKLIFEVCIRWADDDDEQGTFTGQIEASTRDDAITAVARDMAISPDGRGPNASEEDIQQFIEDARTRVIQAWSITEHVFNDLHMVLEDELQGRRLDPAALVALIKDNLDRVAPAKQSKSEATVPLAGANSPELACVLAELVQAVEFTPLGVRGIKAVEAAKIALGKTPGSGYANVSRDATVAQSLEVTGSVDLAVPPKRRFSATWTDAFSDPGTRTVTGGFFTREAGYETQDLLGIAALGVGQTWEAHHYGPAHTVTRLPDTV